MRQQMRLLRRKLDTAWIKKSSEVIQQFVLQQKAFRDASTVGLYLALPREVQTDAIVAACRASGKAVCVPALKRAYNRYEMCSLSEHEPMREAAWGLMEPIKPRWVSTSDVDVMIVPCVAFDAYGRRLGHGGGYYDRLLAEHQGMKLCLAFESQRVTVVPSEVHDVEMDLVITEKKIYDPKLI